MSIENINLGGLSQPYAIFREEIGRSLLRRESADHICPCEVQHSTDLSFDARVGLKDDGYPKYTFSVGAFIGLMDACMTLACNPNFCEHIPMRDETVIEVHNISPHSRFFDYSYIFSNDKLNIWPCTRMLNEPDASGERGNLGNHLFEMAIKFISAHEQAHFLSGHLFYLKKKSVSGMWSEKPGYSLGVRISPARHRALEIQADHLAAVLLTVLFLHGQPFVTQRGFWLPYMNEPSNFLFFAVLGMAVVIGIIDLFEQSENKDPSERTHPSAPARFLTILSAVLNQVGELISDASDQEKWVQALLDQCMVLFSTLGCSPLRPKSFNEYFAAGEVEVTTDEAKECFETEKMANDLHRELGPYRREAMSKFGIANSRLTKE